MASFQWAFARRRYQLDLQSPTLVDIRGEDGALLLAIEGSIALSRDALQGILELLSLRTLALKPMHGWAIAQRIRQVSRKALQIGQGSLHPALQRLKYRAWCWRSGGVSANNRKAKVFSLTKPGRKQLEAEIDDWQRITTAIAPVLE